MTIYIGNLSSQIAEDDLYEIFVEYGEVLQVNIPLDRRTGETRGFAFVDMEDDTQEAQAIIELDGAEY
jgi:RNA recognition motif-containing protein